jgi:uncharacterized membrane protein
MTKTLIRATLLVLVCALVSAPPAAQAAPDAAAPAKAAPAKAAPAKTAPAVKAPAEKVAATPAAKPKPAPLPKVDPSDPVSQISFIIEAFKTGKWAWGVGLLLMLLTLIFNKLVKTRIPPKVLPWVAIGLGVGTNIAMSFATGLVWHQTLSNGLSMGLAAVGGWEAIGKLFKKKAGPTAEADKT